MLSELILLLYMPLHLCNNALCNERSYIYARTRDRLISQLHMIALTRFLSKTFSFFFVGTKYISTDVQRTSKSFPWSSSPNKPRRTNWGPRRTSLTKQLCTSGEEREREEETKFYLCTASTDPSQTQNKDTKRIIKIKMKKNNWNNCYRMLISPSVHSSQKFRFKLPFPGLLFTAFSDK